MLLTRSIFALGLSASASLFAQIVPEPLAQTVPDSPPGIMIRTHDRATGGVIGGMMAGPSAPGTIRFMAAEFGVEGKTVKGAPYSAQAVTESTQTLADGNRIVNKNTVTIARDSEGRTRREQSIKAMGPWASGEKAKTMVFINDPVAQSSYVLDPQNHSVMKTPSVNPEMMIAKFKAEAAHSGGHTMTMSTSTITPDGEHMQAMKIEAETKALEGGDMANESLGSKMIEGVQAEGKRFTRTVPAGQIGNEKPLQFINETWTSTELQVIVQSRHVDPQMGETVYTLTNIQRAEPDASLFSVPADYTVKDTQKTIFDYEKRTN